MALVASASLKTAASFASLGTYAGTATGSLTIDADKGVALTNLNLLYWNTSLSAITGDSHISFLLEHRAFQAAAWSNNNSSNPSQEARSGQEYFLILRNATPGSDTSSVKTLYRFGGGLCDFLTFSNSPTGGYDFTQGIVKVSKESLIKRYVSLDGTVIKTKIVYSFDSAGNKVRIYVNGKLRLTYTPFGTVDYPGVMNSISINNGNTGGLGLGNGTIVYYMSDIEIHNIQYDPLVHDAPSRKYPDIVLFGGIDSFSYDSTNGTTEYASSWEAKRILESQQGIKTTVLSGLGIVGQDYDEVTNANIDATIAGNPNVGFLSPTINSMTAGGAWATTGGQAGWITEVNRVVNRLGNAPTLKLLIIFPVWNFLNSAASAGFGGTNAQAEVLWSSPDILTYMNSYFANLKNNTAIDLAVRNKIIFYDISYATGADETLKNYPRRYTTGSLSGTSNTADPHPTPSYHLMIGKVLAGLITQSSQAILRNGLSIGI